MQLIKDIPELRIQTFTWNQNKCSLHDTPQVRINETKLQLNKWLRHKLSNLKASSILFSTMGYFMCSNMYPFF